MPPVCPRCNKIKSPINFITVKDYPFLKNVTVADNFVCCPNCIIDLQEKYILNTKYEDLPLIISGPWVNKNHAETIISNIFLKKEYYMNHYDWLDKYLPPFLNKLNIDFNTRCPGIISAHADKCYTYRSKWENTGIPFPHGVAVYLLTYLNPYANTVRETNQGWIPPEKWVIDNYPKFKNLLEPIPPYDK